MTHVRATAPDTIRVILCVKFARHAPFGELCDFKQAMIADSRVLHSVEASGSFDFMVEAEPASLAAYQEMLDELAARYGHLIADFEASLICRRHVREEGEASDHCIWIPTTSGLQRIEHDRIDKVTAEGDYVRLYCDGTTWLLHCTMRKLLEQLDPERFVQLSRSTIVRVDYIERLAHDYRRWTAHLFDGSDHPIAKSRSAAIVARLKYDRSSPRIVSSPSATPDEKPKDVEETAVQ